MAPKYASGVVVPKWALKAVALHMGIPEQHPIVMIGDQISATNVHTKIISDRPRPTEGAQCERFC